MRHIFLVAALLFGGKVAAQTLISGSVKNEINKPVENANLIIYESKSDNIVAYSVSDRDGNFKIIFNQVSDSLRLEITLVGFDKEVKQIANRKQENINIILRPAVITLPDVIIKEKAIDINGDTISYNTKNFSDKSDRVIIDVIRKLPGITVTETGKILFNNKAINKFYIDGKDLLENRYNIASNNLPSDAVDQIQVLQNHQPILLLNGIEQSDQAAINLKLNKKSKFRILGNAHAGIGLTPIITDNSATILKFAKDVQYINTLKYNNTGINLDNEIIEQNFSSNSYLSGSVKQDLVSLIKATPPPFNQSRYWFNNNTLLTNNFLVGLNKTFDLKFSAAFEHDRINDSANSNTKIYLPNDTISINENHIGNNNYYKVLTDIILQANTKKIYLKNSLKFQRTWSSANDYLTSTQTNQYLKNPFINLINDFSSFVKVGNTLVGINSYSAYSNLPQYLKITPGQFNSLLNNGLPYDGILQNIQLKGFFTDNSTSFTKKTGIISFGNKLGVTAQFQKLDNNLFIEQNSLLKAAGNNFQNTLDREKVRIYDDFNTNLSTNGFNFSFGIKASFNHLKNNGNNWGGTINRFFFNPNLNILYRFDAFWETNLNASTSNNISYDSNPSFILQNYRSLINNDIPARESKTSNISYRLGYKNIINAVYSNFDIGYSYSISNILMSTTYDGILLTRTALLQENPYSNLNIGWNINKYYLGLRTAFDLYLKYSKAKSRQLQQGLLGNFSSDAYITGSKISTKPNKSFAIEHGFQLTLDKTKSISLSGKEDYPTVKIINQNFVVKYFLPKEFQTHLNIEHYYNDNGLSKSKNYFFTDFTVLKSLIKPKLDFSITALNIFDIKSYKYYLNDANILINSEYTLRGRMLMFKASFQF